MIVFVFAFLMMVLVVVLLKGPVPSAKKVIEKIEGKRPSKSQPPSKTLETEVKEAYKEPSPEVKVQTQKDYDRLKKSTEKQREALKRPRTLGERFKAGLKNIPIIVNNAIDNYTPVGHVMTAYETHRSKKKLAKDPSAPKDYFIHGVAQNRGAYWRAMRQSRKEGRAGIGLSINHRQSTDQKVDSAFKQMDAYPRGGNDNVLRGHSSGATLGADMATDPRIVKYGLKKGLGIAPDPQGFKPKNIYQHALSLVGLAKDDNVNTHRGRARAVKRSQAQKKIPWYSISGQNDMLITPPDAYDKTADRNIVLDGSETTHFHTAFTGKKANQALSRIAHAGPKPGKSYEPGVTGREAYMAK